MAIPTVDLSVAEVCDCSITPEISSVAGLRSGIAALGVTFHGSRESLRYPDDPSRIDQLSAKGFEKVRAGVAADTGDVHTPNMTLKNAALLALIGTTLMTALLVWDFVFNVLNLLRGLVPAVTLFSSFIYPRRGTLRTRRL